MNVFSNALLPLLRGELCQTEAKAFVYVVPHNPPMSPMKKVLRDLFCVVDEPIGAQRDQATRPRTHSQQAEQESHSGLNLPGEH